MSYAAELFSPPNLSDGETGDDGWTVESLNYVVKPRPKSQFKTILDSKVIFGHAGRDSELRTRTRDGVAEFEVTHTLDGFTLEERLSCGTQGGLQPHKLERYTKDPTGEIIQGETIDYEKSPMQFPTGTYPEVMLPFLMRWVPRDGKTRAAYAYTNDRFVARVYYERRKRTTITTPAGRFEADEVWMYPDLNDWIAMGGLLTKLAKPLLPRYNIWFETRAPHRVVRFEGPYGPPGAPEVLLDLDR